MHRTPGYHVSIRVIVAAALVGPIASCDEQAPAPPPAMSGQAARTVPSQWRQLDDVYLVSVPADEADEALAAASAEARRTAPDARDSWEHTAAPLRDRWAIKWAAPRLDGGVEQVWVQPLQWSAFRIEGRLVSEPQSELACGRAGGELAGFPIEEMTDWIFLSVGDWNGPREGGFTVKVLEERYGKP